MKVFLTGGTGFLGGALARSLRQRGDEVLALAREVGKAKALAREGCEIVSGDLSDVSLLASAMSDCDAAVHAAAVFEVGVPESERVRLTVANIAGTRHILRAARQSEIARLVYVSTVAVFGNTRGSVADESTPLAEDAATYYEWTKIRAYCLVRRAATEGLPVVTVLPSTIYGPGDRSQLGQIMRQFLQGKAPLMLFPDTAGFSLVHVDDVAAGILLALDDGQLGQEYILAGDIATMRALMRQLAEVVGRPAPERGVPPFLLRRFLPHAKRLARNLGFPANVREAVAGLDGYTYWASHAKAARELGYEPRSLRDGLQQTLLAEDWLGASGEISAEREPPVATTVSRGGAD
jgi:nucleoside-diphosphate-sugar epimerase